MELKAETSADYEYIDSGNGARLERFGPYLFDRPSPVALWSRAKPEQWTPAAGVYHRSSSGGGHWQFRARLPEVWPVRWGQLVFEVKPTGFGHMGLFPEHTCHWSWVRDQIRGGGAPCRVLNLFAYTGAMSLVCAAAGAEVCHVDAVKDVNDWARRNAASSGLGGAAIRWITDDVMKFVAREIRRGRRYDAIVLDPPSYGKGPQGEKWILEEELLKLLDLLMQITSESPRFVLFTCHTLGFSPPLMKNLLLPWSNRRGGKIDSGTMTVASPSCPWMLPSGFYARWSAGGSGRDQRSKKD